MKRWTLPLAAALTLTGCGAATAGKPPAEPAAAPATSPATASPMSRQAAAKYYLGIVKRWNATWDKCTVIDTWSESTPPMERRALAACRELPGVLSQLIKNAEHPPAPWPAEVRGPMLDLVDSQRASYYSCIKQLRRVSTIDAYLRAGQSCPDRSGDHTGEIVRAHLGVAPQD
jgi:hypothetical protein